MTNSEQVLLRAQNTIGQYGLENRMPLPIGRLSMVNMVQWLKLTLAILVMKDQCVTGNRIVLTCISTSLSCSRQKMSEICKAGSKWSVCYLVESCLFDKCRSIRADRLAHHWLDRLVRLEMVACTVTLPAWPMPPTLYTSQQDSKFDSFMRIVTRTKPFSD